MSETDARLWLKDIRKQRKKMIETQDAWGYRNENLATYWIEPFVVGPNQQMPTVETVCGCCGGTGRARKPMYEKEYA